MVSSDFRVLWLMLAIDGYGRRLQHSSLISLLGFTTITRTDNFSKNTILFKENRSVLYSRIVAPAGGCLG